MDKLRGRNLEAEARALELSLEALKVEIQIANERVIQTRDDYETAKRIAQKLEQRRKAELDELRVILTDRTASRRTS